MFEELDKKTRREYLASSITGSAVLAGFMSGLREFSKRREILKEEATEVRNRFNEEELVADLNRIQSGILNPSHVEITPTNSYGITAELYSNADTENIQGNLAEIIKQEEYADQIDQTLNTAIDSIGTEEPLDSYKFIVYADPGSIQFPVSTDYIEQLEETGGLDEIFSNNNEDIQNYLVQ